MKKMTKILAGLAMVAFAVFLVSFVQEGKKAWDVPAKYQAMKNPNAGKKEAIATGKTMFAKYCRSCHGNNGEGDGPRSHSLKTKIMSFTSAEFKAEKDGEIYYQAIVGRGEMPNFEKRITDNEDRWALVSYIRSLKKK